MKTLSVEFNGIRLDDYLVVINGFNRGIGTSRSNNYAKVANRRGRVYSDHTNDQGSFQMPFVLIYDVMKKRRELAKILNVSEPAPLIFGDEPDKVYYAVPTGDINVDETNFLGKGTITWEVPDGVAYAIEEKVIDNDPHGLTNLPAKGKGRNLFRGYPSNSPLRVNKTSYYYQYPFTANGNRIVLKPSTDYIFTWSYKEISGAAGSMSLGYANEMYDFILDLAQVQTVIGYIHFKTPDILPHPYLGIRFNRTGAPSNSVTDYWDLAIREGTEITPWTPAPEDPKVIPSDLKNKIAGSDVENPNVFMNGLAINSLLPPNSPYWREADTVNYLKLAMLDGNTYDWAFNSNGIYSQRRISWNILEIVTREYPELKGITLDKLKTIFKGFASEFWAKGSSPARNRVIYGLWSPNGNAWSTWADYNGTDIGKTVIASNNQAILTADGFIHVLVYADPSDGTTASSVSIDYANIEISLQLPLSDEIVIVNNGTADVYPKFEIEGTGDNGYLELVSEHGAVRSGYPTAVDGVTLQRSERLMYERFNNTSLWQLNDPHARIFHPYANASGTVESDAYESFTYPKDYGNGNITSGNWHGPTLTRKLDLDSSGDFGVENFSLYQFMVMRDTFAERVGRFEMNLQDEDDNIIFSFQVTNSSAASSNNEIWMYLGNQEIYRDTSTWRWQNLLGGLNLEKFGNLWKYTIRNDERKLFDSREYLDGLNILSKKKICRVTVWFGVWKDYKPMIKPQFGISEIHIHKHNVPYWVDVPNKWMGDWKVEINNNESKIYSISQAGHKIIDMIDADIGNQYFACPPGETRIRILRSSFADMPKVTATIREGYL